MFNLFPFIIFVTQLEINKILSTRHLNSIDTNMQPHFKLQVVYIRIYIALCLTVDSQ